MGLNSFWNSSSSLWNFSLLFIAFSFSKFQYCFTYEYIPHVTNWTFSWNGLIYFEFLKCNGIFSSLYCLFLQKLWNEITYMQKFVIT